MTASLWTIFYDIFYCDKFYMIFIGRMWLSINTFINGRVSIFEVDNGGDVGDGDVGHLLGLDVHEDQAAAQVVRVLDLRQAADDFSHDFVDLVVWKFDQK